jgi:uncharacterized membrane protein
MWFRLSRWLSKFSSNWVALIGLVVFMLFTILMLPKQTANEDSAMVGVGSPDLSIYYSSADLYNMAEAYGEAGRAKYIQVRFTFDLIWPIVYTFFLVTSISWVFAKAFLPKSNWQLANLAPVLGMVFDYLENIAASWVMWRYPLRTPVVDWLAGVFTAFKWILISGSFILLLIGIFVAVIRWVRRTNNANDN